MIIQRRGRGRKLIVSFVLLVTITAIIIGGIFFLHRQINSLANNQPSNPTVSSVFSFDETEGWWRGATDETTMAIFDSNDTHACFISAEYIKSKIDVAADLVKAQRELARNGNYTMNELGTKTLALQTPSGTQSYELHQFSITTPNGAEMVKEGQETGYIQLAKGYVKLSGYCDLSSQLEGTITALKAIRIKER